MRIGWVLLALSACGGSMARSLSDAADAGVIAAGDAGVDAGVPSLAGCPVFPLGNAWNRDVSSEPVDPHSADYIAFMGAGSLHLHPDFGGSIRPAPRRRAGGSSAGSDVIPLRPAKRAPSVPVSRGRPHPGERRSARDPPPARRVQDLPDVQHTRPARP